jgi:hypothetical protein
MWVTPALFSLREIYLLSKHELWRDEIQAWLIAFQSENISQLFTNLRYEGRPPLWHFLLWILNNFSSNPESLKVLTCAIYITTIFMLYRLNAFSYSTKIVISLGFYFSYGYAVVSRDYNLLLLFCIILLYMNEKKCRQKYVYIICILLSLTNPFGSVISIFWILVQAGVSIRTIRIFWNQASGVLPKMIPILVILAYFRMPGDSIFQPNFDLHPKSFVTALSVVFIKPFLPYAETNKINFLNIVLSLLIILLLFAVFICVDSDIKLALMVASFMLFVNALIGYSFYWWHFGASILVFLLAIAIQLQRQEAIRRRKLLVYSVGIMLILQVCGSVNGLGRDFHGIANYSNIRNTAEYILLKYPGAIVVSDSQVFGTPLYAYLKPDRIFFPSTGKFSYFTSWKSSEFRVVTEEELLTVALNFENSIIVTSRFLEFQDPRVRKAESFSGAVWENYHIYEVVK